MSSHQTSPTGFTAGSPTGSSSVSSSEDESLDLANPDHDLNHRDTAEAESDADELQEDIEELLRNTPATPLRDAAPEPQVSIPMATLMTLLESVRFSCNLR